jgi:hypothetical protein
MPIIREELKERTLGESKAMNIDKEGIIDLPTAAINFQEVKHAKEASIEYPITVAYENDYFNLNPFYDKIRFKSGNSFLEEQLNLANYWMRTSQATKKVFSPKFSSEIKSTSRLADFTTIISMYSDASYVTITERPSFIGTKKAIETYKKEMQKEGIEKEVLLLLNMNQDEIIYARKYHLAQRLGLYGRIINWGGIADRWRNMELTINDYNSRMLRIINDIPRAYETKNAYLSTAILLGDVVCHAPILGHGSTPPKGQKVLSDKQKKKIASVNSTRFYAPNNGMYRHSDYKRDKITQSDCDCEPDKYAGGTVDDFFATYYNQLNKVLDIHNAASLYKTIKELRKLIGSGLGASLNNMKYARNILEDIYHINPNQMRL